MIWNETTHAKKMWNTKQRSWLLANCMYVKQKRRNCRHIHVAVIDRWDTEWKVVMRLPWVTCRYQRWSRLVWNSLLALLWNCVQNVLTAMTIRCKIYFLFFLFVASANLENIFTTKNSQIYSTNFMCVGCSSIVWLTIWLHVGEAMNMLGYNSLWISLPRPL